MKFSGAVACFIVAVDCAEKALGTQTQSLFAPNALWVWWIVAFMWFVGALRFVISID